MRLVSRILMLMLMALALNIHMGGAALAESGKAEEQWRAILWESVKWQKSGTGQLGAAAHIKIPEGYMFTGRKGTQALMQLFGNQWNEFQQGYIGPEDLKWFIVFEYENTGHIKDDEKEKLDADAILASLKDASKSANEERESQGLPTQSTVGWLMPPHYNEKTHSLEWARLMEFGGEESVNYEITILGREGVVYAIVVTAPDDFESVKAKTSALLEGFAFNPGQTYEEYREGDQLADFGLLGLLGVEEDPGILGKMSLSADENADASEGGNIFDKFGKAILAVAALIALGVICLVQKLSGRKNSNLDPNRHRGN